MLSHTAGRKCGRSRQVSSNCSQGENSCVTAFRTQKVSQCLQQGFRGRLGLGWSGCARVYGLGIMAAPLTRPICHLPGRAKSSDCSTDGLLEKKRLQARQLIPSNPTTHTFTHIRTSRDLEAGGPFPVMQIFSFPFSQTATTTNATYTPGTCTMSQEHTKWTFLIWLLANIRCST